TIMTVLIHSETARRTTFSKASKREMTDASKDVLIAAKNKRIKELEKEVQRLKGILARRYGEDYDKGI
ncbi:hypothetical protein TheetDRAFT_0001, partial [Thermoanaerobacter ethanolicus JW 200]